MNKDIEKVKQVARTLVAGIPADVEELGGSPFTGPVVGEQFGKMLAMIEALAKSVNILAEAVETSDEKLQKFSKELEKLKWKN